MDEQKFKVFARPILGNYSWRVEIIDREFGTCSKEVSDFIGSLEYNSLRCNLVPMGMLFCISRKIYQQCPAQNQHELCSAARQSFNYHDQLMMELRFMEQKRKQ